MFAYRNQEPAQKPSNEENYGIFIKLKRVVLAGILVISILSFSWIAYSSYKYSGRPDNIEEVKLVRKDIAPVRVAPSEPGGEVLNNQDKLIYKNFESMRNANSPNKPKPDAYANDKIADAFEEPSPQLAKQDDEKKPEVKKAEVVVTDNKKPEVKKTEVIVAENKKPEAKKPVAVVHENKKPKPKEVASRKEVDKALEDKKKINSVFDVIE